MSADTPLPTLRTTREEALTYIRPGVSLASSERARQGHDALVAHDLLARTVAAEAERDRYRKALEEVVNPLKFMREQADAEGNRLSGMAYLIANSLNHVQEIARAALTPKEE